VSFYDRRDDGWQLLRSWQFFGDMYTQPKELTELRPPVSSRSVGADITLERSEQMPKYLDR